MSAVGHDIAETLSRSGGTFSIEQIAGIMQIINRRTTPQDEDDALIKHVIFMQLVDVMDTAVVFAQADIEEERPAAGFSGVGVKKFIPDEVRSYDLTHDNTNAALLTFPPPGIGTFNPSTIGVKGMGAAQTPGTEYMIIDDHAWWNSTTDFMACGWIYLKANGGSDEMIFNKGTDQWELKTISGDTLRFRVEVGGTMRDLDFAYTPDTWYRFLVQAQSGNQELWIDGTEEATAAHSGSIGVNTTNVGIFGTAAGATLLGDGNAISWLSFADGFGDATWVSNFFTLGLMDFDTDIADTPEEITTIPFIGDLQEQPVSFEGMFFAT